MALMAAKGEITPMPVAAIFADTQAEPASVYRWLDWLEKQLPFPVYRVTAGNLVEATLRKRVSRKNGKQYMKYFIPSFGVNPDGSFGMMPRKCTHDFKLLPLLRKTRELAQIKRGEKAVRVHQWIGISLDEAQRMKDAKAPWILNVYPLVDRRINRWDCLRWMTENGYPKPPKSACVFCPYHSDFVWRNLKTNEPIEFAKAVRFELQMQATAKAQGIKQVEYLHASRIPLSEVDFSTEEERGQLNMFNNECEGMCGV
jgi:hypothetical protein